MKTKKSFQSRAWWQIGAKKKALLTILAFLVIIGLVYAEPIPSYGAVVIRDSITYGLLDSDPSLVNQVPDPVEPGGIVEIRFKVENIGAENIDDAVFELVPEYPFTIYPGMSKIRKVGGLHMQQVGEEAYLLYYKLIVDKDAISGNNPIKIKYSADSGVSWTQKKFDVRVQSSDAILSIDSVRLEPEQIEQGKEAILTLTLHNKASTLLKDIRINLEVLKERTTSTSVVTTELPIVPVGSTNEKTLDNVAGGDSVNVSFSLVAESTAENKIYKLPINLRYSDILGKNYSITYYTSLAVGEKPDLVASLDSTEIYVAGQSGTVSLRFTNKGASDVKFLYATLMNSEQYKIISNSEAYVGNIDSDDYESADFKIAVKNTRSKSVQMPLRMEYRDANNRVFVKELIVNLPLYSSSEAKKYGFITGGSMLGSLIPLIIILGAVWLYFKKKKKVDIFKWGWSKLSSRFKKKK